MKNNFEQIIARLTPTLKRITHKLNGHFAFFNDDDLCQEALIHLWARFREGKLCDKTDSYILQGCYYHLKNYIRVAMDKTKTLSLENPIDDDGTMLGEVIPADGRSPAELAEKETLSEELGRIGLEKRELEVIEMFMTGLTTREIGVRLGISHVAVVKLRHKIQKKCRCLEKEIGGGYQN